MKGANNVTQETVLILLRIKGFAKVEQVIECLATTTEQVEETLSELAASGWTATTKLGIKLTAEGQHRADLASRREHLACVSSELEAAYAQFNVTNRKLKQIVTDWQARIVDGETTPNDHTDPSYDHSVRSRLLELHQNAVHSASSFQDLAPRFEHYVTRLNRAYKRISEGEDRFVAAPIIDSYHTIWFEMHEDIIRLCGRSRAEEAREGHAV